MVVGELARECGPVAGELGVLEDDGLMSLVEQRGELEIRRELTIDGGGGAIEIALPPRVAAATKTIEQVHAAMLPQRHVCTNGS